MADNLKPAGNPVFTERLDKQNVPDHNVNPLVTLGVLKTKCELFSKIFNF